MSIAWLDIILFVVVFVSAILAMLRGFSRELFSILSWGGAIVAGFFGYPYGSGILVHMLPDLATYPQLPAWSAGFGIFLLVLIILSYITSFIADRIIDSRVGALDRTLGFIFGIARGILLMSISLVAFMWLSNSNIPPWIENAKTRPALLGIATWINDALPSDMEQVILDILDTRSGDN